MWIFTFKFSLPGEVILNTKLIQLAGLFSLGFPGFFRLATVYIFSEFFSKDFADQYSNYFLIVGFASVLIGVPLASTSLSKFEYIKLKQLMLYGLLTSLFVCSVTCFLLDFNDLFFVLIAIVCSFFVSIYEYFKQILINNLRYEILFLSYIASILLSVAIFYTDINSVDYYSFFIILSLCIPTIFAVYYTYSSAALFSESIDLRSVFNFSIISLLSTSISFLLPILLIGFSSDLSSSEVLKTSTFAAIFMITSRLYANNFIKILRQEHDVYIDIFIEVKKLALFVFVSTTVFSLIAFFMEFEHLIQNILLFVSIFFTQLTLPYACIFSVSGRSDVLLKVNFQSAFLSIFVFLSVYFIFPISTYFLLFCFIANSVFKIFFFQKIYAESKCSFKHL